MVRRRAAVAFVLLAGLAAQEPGKSFFEQPPFDGAPLDLAAMAQRLEQDGAMVAVVDVIPDSVRSGLRDLAEQLTDEERDSLLLGGSSVSAVAAAMAVLEADDQGTPRALLRQLEACGVLAASGRESALQSRTGVADLPAWRTSLGPLARRRAAALSARLFAADSGADDAMLARALELVPHPEGMPRWRVLGESVRRRGAAASRRAWLLLVDALLEVGELDAAGAALRHAEQPAPSARRDERTWVALERAALAQRIDAARRLREAAVAPGLDGAIARLRLLRLTDKEAAIATARQLVEQQVPHALPASLLAAEAVFAGRRDEAVRWLDAAIEQPGVDVLPATLLLLTRILPLVRGDRPGGDEAVVRERLDALFTRLDGMLADDPEEAAELFRTLRDFGWPDADMSLRLLESLPDALAVWDRLPNSVDACRLVLAAALRSEDPAAAAAALARPLPATLAARPDLVLQRAKATVSIALRGGADAMQAQVDAALELLARVQGDELDAEFLRGVLAWSRGITTGAREALESARAHFHAARRLVTEVEGFEAAVACWVADTVLDEQADPAIMRYRRVADVPAAQSAMVPVLVTMALTDPAADVATLRRVAGQLAPWEHYACEAAVAAAAEARGDDDGARTAARAALAIDLSGRPRAAQGIEQGIAEAHELRWNMMASVSRAGVDLLVSTTLLPLPRLPSREHLKQLARD